MNTKKHHEFTLWIHSEERDVEKVPAIIFDEGTSYDEIVLIMLALDELGVYCSLTCDTWNEFIKSDSEEIKID